MGPRKWSNERGLRYKENQAQRHSPCNFGTIALWRPSKALGPSTRAEPILLLVPPLAVQRSHHLMGGLQRLQRLRLGDEPRMLPFRPFTGDGSFCMSSGVKGVYRV